MTTPRTHHIPAERFIQLDPSEEATVLDGKLRPLTPPPEACRATLGARIPDILCVIAIAGFLGLILSLVAMLIFN